MLRLETTTPELKELRKQMFGLIASPKQRTYIESRRRFLLTQRSLQEDNAFLRKELDTLTSAKATLTSKNATLTNENATLTSKNATLTSKNATLTDKVETLERRLQEKDDDTRRLIYDMLATSASGRFNKPVAEVKTLLEGRTLKTLNEACNALTRSIDYDEFVKILSENR